MQEEEEEEGQALGPGGGGGEEESARGGISPSPEGSPEEEPPPPRAEQPPGGEAMPSALYQPPLGGGEGPRCPPPGLGGLPGPQRLPPGGYGRGGLPGSLGSAAGRLRADDAQPGRKPPPPPPLLLPLLPPPPPPLPPSSSSCSPPLLQELPPDAPRDPAAALRLALDQLARLGFQEEQEAEEEEEEEEEGRGRGRGEAEGGRRSRGGGGAPPEEEEARKSARGAAGPLGEEEEEEDARMEAREAGGLDHFAFPAAGGGMLLRPPPPRDGEGSPPASPAPLLGGLPPHLGGGAGRVPLLPPPPPPPWPPQHPLLAGPLAPHKRSVNMTECVPVPSSEHVAEIVGRQGCKIKALRAKTNTYIKTPVRGEEPVFIVTGRKEDVEMAKREILSAAEHFSMIRATRNRVNGVTGSVLGPPNLLGQTTIQVRVPYRVVGLVVGPKGATIKRIQQQTHTYIVTPSRDKEPVFEVTGMPENVDRAREEIEAHITMRTGAFIDVNTENDFHSNGTDVCLDLLGGGPSGLWSKAPNPTRRTLPSQRNDNLSSLGTSVSATELYFEGAPRSPFDSNSSFPFSEPPTSLLGSEDCDFGFDFLALDLTTPANIWSPFESPTNPLQAFGSSSSSSINGTSQRRHSSFSGTTTPSHSPTLPESTAALEHPLVRRIQSDPVSALPWLPSQGSLSSFSNSTGYSSSSSLPSSISGASGSPTDSSSSDGACKNSRECMVCFESEVIAALVPCGHNLFCMECAMRICGRPDPECPACHTPATQAIHIFS
uniref:RNA-binding protein MEX3D n=1 Tax=Pogona vitticeps TaxID=103695 RepID=A0A6J0SN96_9SAUR